ncbi:MAG: elongation factor Ts [Ignavibacteriae bacterium HGW-Ignavibacteriae-2]|jgi:elongation factor Ts|nr:translation elongation factor Ts [Bacteroidota bacterium]PKL90332.1 MAG: elongation factor Ts [Ignavibacteriae bacterium HGW-Ignavibacteriae-2]
MSISASQVKELRDKTGAGMMDCKQALTEANGDYEKAIEILRKKGASVAAKRSERDANEGIVKIKVFNDGKEAVIAEVNCETDFVANSDDFLSFADFILNAIVKNKPASVQDLIASEYDGKKVSDELETIIGKIGEKIEISRFAIENVENGLLVDYIHHGSKLGVLIKAENTDGADIVNLLKDFAMQTAAMKPLYLSIEDVSKEAIEKEIDIYKEISRKEGKPEQILEKIALGKLNKFYQEVCLLEQAFIKDNTKAIKEVVADFNKAHSKNVKISKFYRYHLSDEKK